MPLPITIENTFAGQSGNVPASELDANFGQLVTANNTVNTFSTFFVDAGSANAINLTVPIGLTYGFSAGLVFDVLVAATNTGATTLSINGGGTAPVVDAIGNALGPNALLIGGAYRLLCNGTSYQLLGGASNAFNMTPTGVTTSPSVACQYNLIWPHVFISITAASWVSNSVTFTMTGLPSFIYPARTMSIALADGSLVNNGLQASVANGFACRAILTAGSGVIVFQRNCSSTGWTASGTKGFDTTIPNVTFGWPLT